VRYDDFSTVTRSLSATSGVHDTTTVTALAQQLLDRTAAQMRPVRLLGVSVHNLVVPSADVVADAGLLPFEESGPVA
jgi:nucleotidyltransferase/DNA polymerase involved in DNA repair